ncbi:hypothetical protein C2E23DRAFT_935524 [Lenzites betulinus]|nr:hypothetical protein C2E23DRAFT_935524 [Lenzites betulinus]
MLPSNNGDNIATGSQDLPVDIPATEAAQRITLCGPRPSSEPPTWNQDQYDRVERLYISIFKVNADMKAARDKFLERFDLRAEEYHAWLMQLVVYMVRENDSHRQRISEALRADAYRARELQSMDALRIKFFEVNHVADGIRSELSKMVQLYQKHRMRIRSSQRDGIRIQLDYVRQGISTCVTQERAARYRVRNMQPALAVLMLPEDELEVLTGSLPPYSTNAEIESRLAGPIRILFGVLSECSKIRRSAGSHMLQVLNIVRPDVGAATRDRDAIIPDYELLDRNMRSSAARQSSVFDAIELELDAARSLPLVLCTEVGNIPIADLNEVLASYEELLGELNSISMQQEELQDSLAQASIELLAATLPSPPAHSKILFRVRTFYIVNDSAPMSEYLYLDPRTLFDIISLPPFALWIVLVGNLLFSTIPPRRSPLLHFYPSASPVTFCDQVPLESLFATCNPLVANHLFHILSRRRSLLTIS